MAGLAWLRSRREQQPREQAAAAKDPAAAVIDDPHKGLAVDPLRVDLGYALVALVDGRKDGELLGRVASLRKDMAAELGILVPPIRFRDNLRLPSHQYAVFIRGSRVASGTLYPNQLLAVPRGTVGGKLLGREAAEPVSGGTGVWIAPTRRGRAEMMNYAVYEPATVLVRHLAAVVRERAADLLTREQTVRLLENLRPSCEHLVTEIAAKLPTGRVQRVLQSLLRERVSVRDLEAVLEALADAAERTDDPHELTEAVRAALGEGLTQSFCGDDGRIRVALLDPAHESALTEHVHEAGEAVGADLPPELARTVVDSLHGSLDTLRRNGRPPVVLCAPTVRGLVKTLIRSADPDAAVLAYNEVHSVEVESVTDEESEA